MSAYYGRFLKRRGRFKGKHRQAGLNNPSDGGGKGEKSLIRRIGQNAREHSCGMEKMKQIINNRLITEGQEGA